MIKNRSEKGVILIIAMVNLFILNVIIFSLLEISSNQYRLHLHNCHSSQAIALTDAGIDYARYQMKKSGPGEFTYSLLGYDIKIKIPDKPPYIATSEVSVEDITAKITAKINTAGQFSGGADSYNLEVVK